MWCRHAVCIGGTNTLPAGSLPNPIWRPGHTSADTVASHTDQHTATPAASSRGWNHRGGGAHHHWQASGRQRKTQRRTQTTKQHRTLRMRQNRHHHAPTHRRHRPSPQAHLPLRAFTCRIIIGIGRPGGGDKGNSSSSSMQCSADWRERVRADSRAGG